jgi:hypothetical protein
LPTKQAERSGRTKAGLIDPTLHLEDDHDDEHEEDLVADFGVGSVERSPRVFVVNPPLSSSGFEC